MKVKGFLKDVGGASRITKARISAIDNASPVPVKVDPIHEVAYALHPGRLKLVVTDIRPANSTCKTVRLQAADGRRLPCSGPVSTSCWTFRSETVWSPGRTPSPLPPCAPWARTALWRSRSAPETGSCSSVIMCGTS